MRNNKKFIIVAGYGWSGSSAMVDLLKECQNCYEMGKEFRLLKDPYGIEDLKYYLVDNWDSSHSDNAVRDFIWLVEHLNYTRENYSLKSGLKYGKILGESFISASHSFLDEIIDYQYKGSWWFTDWKKSNLEFLIKKLKKRLRIKKEEFMYHAKPSSEKFKNAVNRYLNNIFKDVEQNIIILDQGLDAYKPFFIKYLNDTRMIIIDRDPRDIYADLVKDNVFLGEERDVHKFIAHYKMLRETKKEIEVMQEVLFVSFENLINNYEYEIVRVFDFLNISIDEHKNRYLYFDPEKSRKNIGIYKTYLTNEEITAIEYALKEYIC